MNEEIEKVGVVEFDWYKLNVYRDLDEPLFLVIDIATVLNYRIGNTYKLLNLVEDDEKLTISIRWSGQRRRMWFVTETGLYNILEQSRVPLARKWRRVINRQLVEMRKEKGNNMSEQFEEWNQYFMDNCYYDDETGTHMVTITVPGGDVDSIPFDEFCEMKGMKIS